jgi:hypothetical protein
MGPRFAQIEVHWDQAKLQRILYVIKDIPGAVGRAVPAALNKSADEIRNWLIREFGSRMRIKRKQSIPDRLTRYPRASSAQWMAGVRIALTRFTVASFTGTQQTAYGVYWSPGAAGAGHIIPRAFLRAKSRNYLSGKDIEVEQAYRRAMRGEKGYADFAVNQAGHVVRATQAGDMVRRYSIKVLRGPSLAMVFTKAPNLVAQAEARGEQILTKKLESQVDRFTKLPA